MRWHSFTRIDSTSSSLSYERIHSSDIFFFFLKNLVERMVHFLFDQRPERTRRCRLFAMVSNYKLYISIFFFSFFLSRRRRSHSLSLPSPLLWPAWRLEISLIHRSQAPRSFPPLPHSRLYLSARMDSGIVEAKSNNLSQQYMKIHIDMCEESQRVAETWSFFSSLVKFPTYRRSSSPPGLPDSISITYPFSLKCLILLMHESTSSHSNFNFDAALFLLQLSAKPASIVIITPPSTSVETRIISSFLNIHIFCVIFFSQRGSLLDQAQWTDQQESGEEEERKNM